MSGDRNLQMRILGRTGIAVSPLGLGGAGFLMNQHRPVTELSATRLLRLARRLGINYVDTAPLYGDGLSEARIGNALDADTGVVIATKVGLSEHGGSMVYELAWNQVIASVEASLLRLRRTSIDLVQIHELTPDKWKSVMGKRGALAALRSLQAAGLVHHVGVTGSDVPALKRAVDSGEFDVVQVWRRWNLLDRSAESILEAAHRTNVGVVVGGPFASGILARPTGRTSQFHYVDPSKLERAQVMALADRARSAGIDPASAALQFCLDSRVSVVVVGVRNAAQLRANLVSARDKTAAVFARSLP